MWFEVFCCVLLQGNIGYLFQCLSIAWSAIYLGHVVPIFKCCLQGMILLKGEEKTTETETVESTLSTVCVSESAD